MNERVTEDLRCPCCRGTLTKRADDGDDALEASCGKRFAVRDGIPDLVYPAGQEYLDEHAETYDRSIQFIADLLRVDEQDARRTVVRLLNLPKDARVLEVACGTGPNLPPLLAADPAPASVWALDISPTMLTIAAERTGGPDGPVAYVRGNGVHLPFADDAFDAVLHLGTLNRFDDPAAALAEMSRVVKVGGTVVAGDEGVAPWLQHQPYGQVLARFGDLFKGAPPLAAVPPEAEDVSLRWLMGYAYFVITFTVGSAAPSLNLDVTLPGRPVTVRQVLDAVAKRQRDAE